MNEVYLILGGNLGDRNLTLHKAIEQLRQRAGKVLETSSFYETKAWGYTEQPSFYNCVVRLQTQLTANQLLTCILEIERELGRVRDQKWHERTIDIDILYFNHEVIEQEALVVPHPLLQDRRFVLVPLAEIAPLFVHPVLLKSNAALLEHCTDPLPVSRV